MFMIVIKIINKYVKYNKIFAEKRSSLKIKEILMLDVIKKFDLNTQL